MQRKRDRNGYKQISAILFFTVCLITVMEIFCRAGFLELSGGASRTVRLREYLSGIFLQTGKQNYYIEKPDKTVCCALCNDHIQFILVHVIAYVQEG